MKINQAKTSFQGVYVVAGTEREVNNLVQCIKKARTPVTTETFVDSFEYAKKRYGTANCAGIITTGYDSIVLSDKKAKNSYLPYKNFLNKTTDKALKKCYPFINFVFETRSTDIPVFDANEIFQFYKKHTLPLDTAFQEMYSDRIGDLNEIRYNAVDAMA